MVEGQEGAESVSMRQGWVGEGRVDTGGNKMSWYHCPFLCHLLLSLDLHQQIGWLWI